MFSFFQTYYKTIYTTTHNGSLEEGRTYFSIFNAMLCNFSLKLVNVMSVGINFSTSVSHQGLFFCFFLLRILVGIVLHRYLLFGYIFLYAVVSLHFLFSVLTFCSNCSKEGETLISHSTECRFPILSLSFFFFNNSFMDKKPDSVRQCMVQ